MSDDTNKSNLQYFEAPSMRELYELMQNWQNQNHTRLLSTSIHKDVVGFCCIALTNPMEVVITDKSGKEHAQVSVNCLLVHEGLS